MTTSTPIPDVPALKAYDKDLPKLQRDLAEATAEAAELQAKMNADVNQTIQVKTEVGPRLKRAIDRQEQLNGEVRARRQAAGEQAAQAMLALPGFRATLREYAEQESYDLEAGARLVLTLHKAQAEGIALPSTIAAVSPSLRTRLCEFKAWLGVHGRLLDLEKVSSDVRAACEVIR